MTKKPRGVVGPLASRKFRWVVLVMFAVGFGLSPLDVAATAWAAETGSAASAGYLLAALSVGSAAGGLIWGHVQHRHHYFAQLITLLAALAVGTAAAGFAPSLPVLAAMLALAGLAVTPIFVVAYLAADLLTAQSARTEATTWVATASNPGIALGAACAGYLVDRTSPQTALLVTGATMAFAAATLWTMHAMMSAGTKRGATS